MEVNFYIGICREMSFFENQLTTKAVICMEASIDNVEYIEIKNIRKKP